MINYSFIHKFPILDKNQTDLFCLVLSFIQHMALQVVPKVDDCVHQVAVTALEEAILNVIIINTLIVSGSDYTYVFR